MKDNSATIKKAAEYIREKLGSFTPQAGIILGSGLGKLADKITDTTVIPYVSVPGFPKATAIGHKGNFICGMLGGKKVIAMQGRYHYYEGYTMDEVVLPVRVMISLGIKYLFVSNAAGGMNPAFKIGDLMLIKDHINLLPNPLIGKNLDEFGPRFPDMTSAYDLGLQQKLKEAAAGLGIGIQEGVYVSCTGPCYETPAEYKYFYAIGADAVGMSTTPEVIVARHSGIAVLGMSVITDVAHETTDEYVTDGELIVRVADEASNKMTRLFEALLEKL